MAAYTQGWGDLPFTHSTIILQDCAHWFISARDGEPNTKPTEQKMPTKPRISFRSSSGTALWLVIYNRAVDTFQSRITEAVQCCAQPMSSNNGFTSACDGEPDTKNNNNHGTKDTGHQTLILTNGRSQNGAIIPKPNERERNEPKHFTQLSSLLQPMFYRLDYF